MVLTNGKVCNRPLCLFFFFFSFFDLPYIRVQVRVRQLLCLTYKQLDDDAPRHGENRGSLRACQRPSCKVGSHPETKLPMVPWSWPPPRRNCADLGSRSSVWQGSPSLAHRWAWGDWPV